MTITNKSPQGNTTSILDVAIITPQCFYKEFQYILDASWAKMSHVASVNNSATSALTPTALITTSFIKNHSQGPYVSLLGSACPAQSYHLIAEV